MTSSKEWLSTGEASECLGITARTLYRLIDDGHLCAFKFGRVIRVRRSDLDDYMRASRLRPGQLRHLRVVRTANDDLI